MARNLGLDMRSLEADLRLVGRSVEQHMVQKVLLAVFGLALPTLIGVLWAFLGISLPTFLPAGGALALGVFFFFVPDITRPQRGGASAAPSSASRWARSSTSW